MYIYILSFQEHAYIIILEILLLLLKMSIEDCLDLWDFCCMGEWGPNIWNCGVGKKKLWCF